MLRNFLPADRQKKLNDQVPMTVKTSQKKVSIQPGRAMQSINSVTALFAKKSLNAVQGLLSQSAERLSSGLRINRAKEDSAGLGISQELQRQTRAFAMASRNTNDAISMAQTAEGSLQNVSQMLLRLKALSTQGANESLSKDQRAAIADEIGQIRNEINAITERSTFNGLKLLRGDFSQAVKDEFSKASELDGTNNSVFASSTIKLGVESPASTDNTKSRFSIADIQADQALDGRYTLSNNGAVITLSATINGETKSECSLPRQVDSPIGDISAGLGCCQF